MRDDHDGHTGFVRGILQQFENRLAGIVVQSAGRLVTEQQFRILGERARDRDTLLLTAGELRREIIDAGSKSDLGQCFPGVHRILADLRGQRNVLERGQVLNQIVELKNKTDLVASVGGQLAGVVFGNLFTIEKYSSFGERVHAAKDIQQRGLARAGRADDDTDLTFFNLKRGVAQCLNGDFSHMVDFFYVLKFYKRFHG